MIRTNDEEKTLVAPLPNRASIQDGTIVSSNATMVELQSNLGTMVINEEEEDTMKSRW